MKNIINIVLILSLFGCALKKPDSVEQIVEPEPVPEVSPKKKTTLYSLFFSKDEEDEDAGLKSEPIVIKKVRPVVKQPISAQPSPIVKEAPIHKAISKKQAVPPKQAVQVVSPAAEKNEEDSSFFSFFSSKPDVKTNKVEQCIGDANLPISLQRKFEEIQDPKFLSSAIGSPEKGRLCQGKVYQVKKNAQVNLFRTWNSNHLASQYGNWWTFSTPRGSIATFREKNAICYQWTPIDKLSHCRLKAGSKIVVGTGQSVRCSDNLRYPVSDSQQVYILDAQNAVENCRDYDAGFSWKGQVNKR